MTNQSNSTRTKPSVHKTDGSQRARSTKKVGKKTWGGSRSTTRAPYKKYQSDRTTSETRGTGSRTQRSQSQQHAGIIDERVSDNTQTSTRRRTSSATGRGGFKKPFAKKKPFSRFEGGRKFGAQKKTSGRSKRKKAVYDYRVFIKEATLETAQEKKYVPKNHFADFKLHQKLQTNVARHGYENPTPIQDQSIPYAMQGRDVIGIANTGTGKTAAFLLPLIHKMCLDPLQKVLILAPTRELALQIDDECQSFIKDLHMQTIVCIGGTPMHKQLRNVRKNAQIIIGTPGRTKDLVQRKALNLSHVNNVVLDEVDRMLDMGFVTDITALLSKVKKERQSLFFSATLDDKIAKLTLNYLTKPVTVEIASRPTSENVDQNVVFIERGDEKLEKLEAVLKQKECAKVLIFTRTKIGAKRLAQKLYQRGFHADAIHGDMSQGQRQRTLTSFRDGRRINILTATDVVARGIDIDGITHVINYDLPETYEDYIHRIGRTGRGIKLGHALTFFER